MEIGDKNGGLPNSNPLVCLKLESTEDKRDFLQKYCRVVPEERKNPPPTEDAIKNAKVISYDKSKKPLMQVKAVARPLIGTASWDHFPSAFRPRTDRKERSASPGKE